VIATEPTAPPSPSEPPAPGAPTAGYRIGIAAVALATALTLLGLAIPVFLNPVWVSFEQGRARADAWTGYAPSEVDRATGSVLHDLVLGPPAFDVRDDAGRPVLEERERSHLRDVRSVFGSAVAVIGLGVAALVGAASLGAAGGSSRRATVWRGVRLGARGLAVAVVGLGAVSLVAFDAAFELFHRLFFAGGTYSFDPRTDRLVQLFPDQFWSETTIALGVVLLVLAGLADRLAGRGLARSRRVPGAAGARRPAAAAAEAVGR
jgi:integral membrane protein (TIGR01906 family)